MIGKSYIDGLDIFTTYGIFITKGGYNDLLSFPPLKKVNSNNWPEEDGEEVDLSNPVLDTKQVNISFAAIGQNANIDNFIIKLSDGAYHTFILNQIGQTYTLRLVSESKFDLGPGIDLFTLQFADDYPLSEYSYLAPTPGVVIQTGYKLDSKSLSDYGVLILQGSDAEIMKSPPVKTNLLTGIGSTKGAIYDAVEVLYQSKDVTLNCLLRAPTLAEFWQNYNALLFDLTKAGEHMLTVDRTDGSYACHYKSATVTDFSPDIPLWCRFSLTLRFTSFRLESNKYRLPPFYAKLAAFFEYGGPNRLIDKITGISAMVTGTNITWPEIIGSDVLDFSDVTFWNSALVTGYNVAKSRTVPLSFMAGANWAEAATDATHARLFHRDYTTPLRDFAPVLVYNQNLTASEQAEVVDWLNWYYMVMESTNYLTENTNLLIQG